MAFEVRMAKLSPTMETGTINRWLKKEGDKIASGDQLADVETDKASMPLETFDDGVLLKILVGEGKTAKVDELVAVIGKSGEDISALLSKAGSSAAAAPAKPAAASAAAPVKVSAPAPAPAMAAPKPAPVMASAVAHAPGGRVKVSPLAKKIAAERGIDLHNLQATGPGGRIIKRDLDNAPAGGRRGPVMAAALNGAGEDIPLSNIRQTIARRLLQSKQQIPHWYIYADINAGRLWDFREDINADLPEGGTKISFNDIVIKAVALALRKHPEVNATFAETHIHRHGQVNIAVAVATDDGLYTPVLRQVDGLSLDAINAGVKELAKKSREKRLKGEDLQGSGFTISNLGMFGVDHFFGIINPPEAAILSVGAIKDKPVVNAQGQVVAGKVMGVSLSLDHRVIDGAVGAKFMNTLQGLLEHPAKILL